MFNPLEFQKDTIDDLNKSFLNLWKKDEKQLPLVLKSPTKYKYLYTCVSLYL